MTTKIEVNFRYGHKPITVETSLLTAIEVQNWANELLSTDYSQEETTNVLNNITRQQWKRQEIDAKRKRNPLFWKEQSEYDSRTA
jgi:hypothetical protein